ncbi:transcriptional antiterminator [Haladaptatus sp. R4]|nr:transcriptional antiterminator [Haladaptatus sp. R4]
MGDEHNHTRRRFMQTTGALGIAGSTALAGCTSSSKSDNGGKNGGSGEMADKIKFFNAGSLKDDPGTKKNIDRFEKKTGIEVEVNEVPWSNLKTTLITQWRNESSKVDAFNGPTWWLADFVAADWVEPLPLTKKHLNKFPDNLKELVMFDGKPYMAPQLGKWGNFLYDKQYFEKQGISSPPDTWDDVLKLGDKVGNDRSAFGFTWANKDVFMFKQFLWQAGGQVFNDKHEPVFADKGVKVFDEFLTPLRKKGLLPSGIQSMNEGNVGDAFIGGKFATVEGWTPLGSRALDEGWKKDRLGIAKPPKGPASRATFQDSNAVGVSAFSKRKKAAKKFAEFMSEEESCKTDMVVEGNPAVMPSVYDSDEVKKKYPKELRDNMKYNLKHATSEIYRLQPQVDDILSSNITPVFLGKKDAHDALTAAQQDIKSLYKKNKIL